MSQIEFINYWNLGKTLDLGHYPKNQEIPFSLTDLDNEKNFLVNPGPNWSKDSFTYKYNSHGFRSREFDLNPGKPILLTLGCSHTVGVGIPQEDSWPEQLGKQYFPDHVVYNAGLGGSSPDTVARLAVNMIPILNPDLVVILWPNFARYELYADTKTKNIVAHKGPWQNDFSAEHLEGNNNYNNLNKNKIILELLQSIYKFKLLSIDSDHIFNTLTKGYTKARDNAHFGPDWHKDITDLFYSQYQDNENG